ncbi:CLUMA_CG007323, isoform A, partial [Clunio marinus]
MESQCGAIDIERFDEMALKKKLLDGIKFHGIERTSQFQKIVISPCVRGDNVIAQSHFGSGKSVSLAISALQKVDTNINKCQILILTPTRKNTSKIHALITSIGEFIHSHCLSVVAPAEKYDFNEELPQILIGTPGRVLQIIESGLVTTNMIKLLCLNETYQLLSRGYSDLIKSISEKLSKDKQTILFTSVMQPEINDLSKEIIEDYLNATRIVNETTCDIHQFFINAKNEEEKLKMLHEICCESDDENRGIIFCSDSNGSILTKELLGMNLNVAHLSQEDEIILRKFIEGKIRFIITDSVDHFRNIPSLNSGKSFKIINFDIPNLYEIYPERISVGHRVGIKRIVLNLTTDESLETL